MTPLGDSATPTQERTTRGALRRRRRPLPHEQARRQAWGRRWGPLLSQAAAAARATRDHPTT